MSLEPHISPEQTIELVPESPDHVTESVPESSLGTAIADLGDETDVIPTDTKEDEHLDGAKDKDDDDHHHHGGPSTHIERQPIDVSSIPCD